MRTIASCAVALALAACSTPGPARHADFLPDYSKLRRDPKRPSDWTWLKPGADLRVYSRVLFDPIVIIPAPGSATEQLTPEVRAKVVEKFQEILFKTIDPYYNVAKEPAEGVLRVRIALTDVEPATADSPGDPGYRVGSAALEVELMDSVTKECLAEAIDRSEGSLAGTGDVPEKWRHVEGAFIEWSQRLLDFLDSWHDT